MDERFLDNWSMQMRKGLLELCVLNALRGERLYGYDIVRRLRGIPGVLIAEGTIYPLLSRLKSEGLVATELEESSEGPPRKYYRLTAFGRQQLTRMNTCWADLARGIDAITEKRRP